MWYFHTNTRPCALLVAEPVKGITREQEDTMFTVAESGQPMPKEVVLNNGKKLALK